MSTLTVELPLNLDPERARLLLAIRLFEEGDVSLGYAAEMAGYSVCAFIELLGKRGIPTVDYPEGDLDQELTTFDRLDPQTEAE
jgi:predicted HTH domain antitoxin